MINKYCVVFHDNSFNENVVGVLFANKKKAFNFIENYENYRGVKQFTADVWGNIPIERAGVVSKNNLMNGANSPKTFVTIMNVILRGKLK